MILAHAGGGQVSSFPPPLAAKEKKLKETLKQGECWGVGKCLFFFSFFIFIFF